MKKIICCISFLVFAVMANAQLRNVKERVKQRVLDKKNQKINTTADNAVDSVFSKTEKEAKEIVRGKPDSSKTKKGTATDEIINEKNVGGNKQQGNSESVSKNANDQTLFTAYAKFDFVPGEKIIAIEDFSQVAEGDFPDKWNTTSTGDIQRIEGRNEKWLSISKPGVFLPEFITSLPENFTFEFELYCSKDYSFYSSPFHIVFASLKNPGKDFTMWKKYAGGNREGVDCWFHPQDASMKNGHSGYEVWSGGKAAMKNEGSTAQFRSKQNNYTKVSIWRQKNRLRVYMNEEKIWDVPRAFANDVQYNSILLVRDNSRKPEDHYLFSNLRLAVGAADTRDRLITEGKFITRGILFDVNSDKIKPESYGALKDIASVLSENAEIKVKIIGHTDADGDDQSNLDLSKRRALAVKNALINDFGIDGPRMEPDGKGEKEPVDKNLTPEGKANNRRVEFIKV
jgi:outer membrane protein OmpA-like peptidoglycan-associated protein